MDSLFSQDFTPTKIVLACYVPPGNHVPLFTNRASHGFALCTGGTPTYYFDDGTAISTQPGKLIYLPKHSTYTAKSPQPSSCYAINFDFPDDRYHTPFSISLQNTAHYLSLFRTAEQAWNKKSAGYREICFSSLYGIAATLREEFNHNYLSSHVAKLIQPALDYIHSNYPSEVISSEQLAELCGISQVYLRRIFRDVKGMSPNAYIRRQRMCRAAELIDSGLYSIHDAASLSGFLDDSYFSREFHKVYGMSPKAYKSRTVD